jgi:copper(I)-binding protein
VSISRRTAIAVVAGSGLAALGACSSSSGSASDPAIVVEDPWVRTTDGATDTTMTAGFMSLVNPGDANVSLTGTSSSVAMMCQVHEMVKGADGKSVMQEAKNGVVIPAGSHVHLTPGGFHIMIMGLTQKLPVGSEVTLELKFSNGTSKTVVAPVKVFTEETDHYHTPAASASPSMGKNG